MIGILILTGIGLILNDRLKNELKLRAKNIYIISALLASLYVVLQELNIVYFKKNATFDQNDIFFSVIGLLIGYGIIVYTKPKIAFEK